MNQTPMPGGHYHATKWIVISDFPLTSILSPGGEEVILVPSTLRGEG
jgi:hypothetical protein